MSNVTPGTPQGAPPRAGTAQDKEPVVIPASSYDDEASGWTIWVGFAGMMMLLAGSLNVAWGIVALVNDHWVGWRDPSHEFLTVHGWGWMMVILGSVVIISGIGVFTGNLAARIVGVTLAGLSLIGNFLALPLYPFWAVTVIALDAIIIWALAAHGGELKPH